MGRWINKIPSQTAPSKPTKLGFDGFVGTPHSTIINFVTRCCSCLNTKPSIVISNLLSVDDEHDIINGEISERQLCAFIQLWVAQGANKVSGK